jgi:hypothetical protein
MRQGVNLCSQAPGRDRVFPDNRRAFKRYNLRLPVLLFRPGSVVPFVGETRDISIDGFFCNVGEPFTIGELLRSLVILANPCPEPENCPPTCIKGEVEVIHMVADRTKSLFGIGCHIHNYRMVPNPILAEEYLIGDPSKR